MYGKAAKSLLSALFRASREKKSLRPQKPKVRNDLEKLRGRISIELYFDSQKDLDRFLANESEVVRQWAQHLYTASTMRTLVHVDQPTEGGKVIAEFSITPEKP